MRGKGLLRVHEDFRVVALGLPVPAFAGFPLDPPLRSRFQVCVYVCIRVCACFEQIRRGVLRTDRKGAVALYR